MIEYCSWEIESIWKFLKDLEKQIEETEDIEELEDIIAILETLEREICDIETKINELKQKAREKR